MWFRLGALGTAQIKRALPHRYPMLLVDAVIELVPTQQVRATKAVSIAEPWYQALPDGTEPGGYAYPQVLVVESWCQCAALLARADPAATARADPAAHGRDDRAAGGDPGGGGPARSPVAPDEVALLGGLSGVSFGAAVYPGDVIEHRAEVLRRFPGALTVTGESVVGAMRVLRVEQALMALRPATLLQRSTG